MIYNNIIILDANIKNIVDNIIKQRDIYRDKYQIFKTFIETTIQNIEKIRNNLINRIKKKFDLIVKILMIFQIL